MKKIFSILILITCTCTGLSSQEIMQKHYGKVLVIGAHPDDAEYMCAGTMMKLRDQGCEVVSVYFTRGESGIKGKSASEAAQIRTQESLDACRIMGVRAEFLTQIDGKSEINSERYEEMKELIEREKPDMVITHWPIDKHRDHRNCASLVYDAWRQCGHSFDLYYTEVTTGTNTQNFTPTSFVDISDYHDRKMAAIKAHTSQDINEMWPHCQTVMENMRGYQYHCKYAEAFVRQQWTGE